MAERAAERRNKCLRTEQQIEAGPLGAGSAENNVENETQDCIHVVRSTAPAFF